MYKLKRIKPERPIPEQASDNLHVHLHDNLSISVIHREEDCNPPHHHFELITSILNNKYDIFEISKINDNGQYSTCFSEVKFRPDRVSGH